MHRQSILKEAFLSLLLIGAFFLLNRCATAYREAVPAATTTSPQDKRDRSPRAARPEGGLTADALSSDETSAGDQESPEAEESTEKPTARMVVYTGDMQIRVIQPVESLRQVGEMATKLGGHIEKSNFYEGGRRIIIVLRVPVDRFFEAMDLFPRLGTVLSRSLHAEDVTKEFADVESRLQSAKTLKARLERLLENVKNVDEKIKILREINRLATEIETLTARSKYLADRASFSTITLQLTAEPSREDALDRSSPFPWIRRLDPAKRTFEKASSFVPQRPTGFFDNAKNFRDGDPNLFYSPDGTLLRSGQMKNRPAGDVAFWRQALAIEFKRRLYTEVKSAAVPDGQMWVFQVHDGLNIYYYGLSYVVRNGELHVFEAFAPGEAAFKKDGEKMQDFLQSIGGGAK